MNSDSLRFTLLIVAILVVFAWLIDFGSKGHWPPGKRRKARWIMGAAILGAGAWVYLTDLNLRGTTLFEIVGAWEETGGKDWAFVVEHPGVEHQLSVFPHVKGLESASGPLRLRTRLENAGGAALVSDESVYVTESKRGRNAGGTMTWRSAEFRFVPDREGPHRLRVETVDGLVPPRLHLRITDPEKRDGVRAPGY